MPLPRVLFRLPLNSGLCISETLDLKITDGRLMEGAAKSAWVIAKGDQELQTVCTKCGKGSSVPLASILLPSGIPSM